MLINVTNKWLKYKQEIINKKNQNRLTNEAPTLIASNCLGGFLYHWLGLQFRSPFINLFLTPDDFITAMENFDVFMDCPLIEDKDSKMTYPVGIGYKDIRVHFMHYDSFENANLIWTKRKARMDKNKDNIGVLLSNWGGYNIGQLERFDRLEFRHKVVFVDKEYPQINSSYLIKGYSPEVGNLYRTQYMNGKRYIDQFDYVKFINSCVGEENEFEQ